MERFGPPPSFIRGYTTIFMGHMKNEVRAFITASSRPFLAPFFLDACRRRNRRWCASQYFGTRFRGRVLGGGTLPRIVGRKEGVRFRGIFTPYGSKTRSRSIYIYIYIRKASCRGKEFVKFFTAAVRYGSTSRVDPRRLRDFVIHACLCPLSLFSPCEHSTGIVGGTADEMR